MKICFKNKTIEKQFSSKYKKNWRYPEQVKKKLLSTENFIQNAYPPFHFHPLKGDRKEEWSIYLGHTGYRVSMIPCDDKGNEIIEGDIISQCKMIKIVKVTEVSNHYE